MSTESAPKLSSEQLLEYNIVERYQVATNKLGYHKLSSEKESQLIQTMENGRIARGQLLRLKSDHQPPDVEKEIILKEEIIKGFLAQEQLIFSNIGLVIKAVKKYFPKNLYVPSQDFEDLVQVGIVGLIKGTKKFDPGFRVKFDTHVYWWIRSEMSYYLSHQGKMMTIPRDTYRMLMKLRNIFDTYQAQDLAIPDKKELSKLMGGKSTKIIDRLSKLDKSIPKTVSIERDDGSELEIPDNTNVAFEAENNVLAAQVIKLLAGRKFSPIEKQILWDYFGEKRLPIKVMAKKYNQTSDGVNKIINVALKKLSLMIDTN